MLSVPSCTTILHCFVFVYLNMGLRFACLSLVCVLYVTGYTEGLQEHTGVLTACSAPYSTPYHMSPLEEKLAQAVAT